MMRMKKMIMIIPLHHLQLEQKLENKKKMERKKQTRRKRRWRRNNVFTAFRKTMTMMNCFIFHINTSGRRKITKLSE